MKKFILILGLTITSAQLFAQSTEVTEITKDNSWLKAGVIAGLPIGDLDDYASFTLGLDLKGQIMSTNHVGLGLVTGYNHFFAKDDNEGFGNIPVGAFVRYYPRSTGFFVGTDLGYSFVTGIDNADGGFYFRPQIGYHNYSWNFFALYNNVVRSDDNGGDIQYVGLGATYNIRFTRKK